MGTKTYNNYEDLLTFTRASKGHALRPVSYGDELVGNNGFDTDSVWSKIAGATISGGKGHIVTTGAYQSLQQNISAQVGTMYFVTIDVTVNSGAGVYIGIGGGTPDARRFDATSSGSYAVALIAGTSDTSIQISRINATDVDIDNVSVKEVTFDQPDGTLTLFEHPNNIPRVEWDADRNRLGLLVEEARTNEVTHSEDFGVFWQKVASGTGTTPVVTADYAPAPYSANGRASRLQASKTSGAGYSLLQVALGNYTGDSSGSLWVKSNTGANQTVYFRAGSIGAVEKTVTTEWTRLETSVTLSAGQLYLSIGSRDNIGSEDIDILIWGAQLEKNAFVTSYIKTTGATATRAADKATLDLADFGYNHKTGTVLVEFDAKYESGGSGFPRVYEISSGTDSANRILTSFNESNNTLSSAVAIGGSGQCSLSLKTGLTGSVTSKVAFAFAKDDFASSDDGDAVVTDTSGTFEPDDKRTLLAFGASVSGLTNNITGHIKSFKYYPRRLTNAQLEALTEPRSTPTLSLTFDGLESSYTENYIHG